GVNLDLSSTIHSLVAGSLTNFQPTTILVNGQRQTVTGTTRLTPAQGAAVEQVLQTGQQSLLIGGNGNATGGVLNLTAPMGQNLSGLVVPHAVTVIDQMHDLNLSGNFSNSGNFYAVSTQAGALGALIEATNVFNNAGGLLSTVLPAGGLPGVIAPVSNLS